MYIYVYIYMYMCICIYIYIYHIYICLVAGVIFFHLQLLRATAAWYIVTKNL